MSNEWGGRSREGEARAKPGNQLVLNMRLAPLRQAIQHSSSPFELRDNSSGASIWKHSLG